MNPQFAFRRALFTLILSFLWATMAYSATLQAAPSMGPTAQAVDYTVELYPTDDARTQTGSPDTNFGNGHLWVGHPDVHVSLIKFDPLELPAGAEIASAELQLYFTGVYTGTNEVEVGRVQGAWDEATLIGSTPVSYAWSSQFQTVTSTGIDDGSLVTWDVTPLVRAWHAETRVNDGLALRANGGELKAAHSKETGAARNGDPYRGPKLIINYTLAPDEESGRPDLGDAPDSSNHHGLNNTAYVDTGVPGQFPTVWAVPANEAAGPRHDNQTMEGFLGNFVSRERDADQGPDQDGPNNILRAAGGVTGDRADNDRGDDGWRNRNINFADCRTRDLTVRISKGANAELRRMYLNVWFDGNRDGDWADVARCDDPDSGPSEASYEWIVQDHIVDMTAVPAGGYLDFTIETERILNSTQGLTHWMRFTLSEERTVQPRNGGYPDGRGPHPNSLQESLRFGETEDYLQKPPPPAEPGELVLEKRVITTEDPVDYAGYATYQIRLRHVGGGASVDAQIRDQIDYPQHLSPQLDGNGDTYWVAVTSPTGGASPLQADVTYVTDELALPVHELIEWEGTLQPDSEVVLTFEIHVHPFCPAILQTKTIANVAKAHPANGEAIRAEASFEAKCPGYYAGGIQIDPVDNPNDPGDWTNVPWTGTVWNKHPLTVTLGFFQELVNTETTTPTREVLALRTVELGPDEKKQVAFNLRIADEGDDDLSNGGSAAPVGRLFFCILNGEDGHCPANNEYPNLEGMVPPPNWIPQPEELGDAPDSTNHFAGVAMTAYPGVQADFPTVFDPATGAIQGPKHHNPRPLHLGPLVSREAEADGGPDADGVNNIWPPANASDQDWFDDGAQLSNLANCQPARADVRVAITQQAVNWFSNNDRVAYLNIWLDSNHDGDWADGFTCVDEAEQNKDVVEHILIDYPVDVAALGVGLHNLTNIATERVTWPVQGAQEARWIRFTLSEEPSNKPLIFNGIQYGDGRGYATPFRTGETEDYLQVLPGNDAVGPDMAVQMVGRMARVPDEQSVTNIRHLRFRIDYANRGNAPAQGAVLHVGAEDEIRDVETYVLQGSGIPTGPLSKENGRVSINLPDLAAGSSDSLVLGIGPLSAAEVQASAEDIYSATATIELADDLNPNNNVAAVTVQRRTVEKLLLAATVEGDNLWRKADATCRDRVTFAGRGEAMQHIDLYINDDSNIRLQFDADGRMDDGLLTNLPEGRNRIWAEYVDEVNSATLSDDTHRDMANARSFGLIVNTDLPIDPITLLLTGSNGRRYHPSTAGWARGASELDTWRLRSGEQYSMSIASCVDDPNLSIKVEVGDEVLVSLHDDDDDSIYTGSFTAPASVTAASVNAGMATRITVETGGTVQHFSATVEPESQATISDGTTGQAVAGASVVALIDDGTASFGEAPASLMSDPNPQTTGADGLYGFTVANGTYRLLVTASGYQPYQTDDIVVEHGDLAESVKLTPVVADPANHTISMTTSGFVPVELTAGPGEVIEWVNGDLAEHATIAAGKWDSGLLATGASYKVRITAEGTYTYVDESGSTGRIIVDTKAAEPGEPLGQEKAIFLPIIRR